MFATARAELLIRFNAARNRLRPNGLVRDPEGASLLQTFAVAGISTVLLTRAFLAATGYPRVGGRSLHIAHVLWGGGLMLLALTLVLTYLGTPARFLAAVLGGAGFGLFIDEVGKFLTADNNYFFRPAAAIIYVVFAGLVIATRALRQRRRLDEDIRLAGALNIALGGLTAGLTERARQQAYALLGPVHEDTAEEVPVRQLLATLPTRAPERPSLAERLTDRLLDLVEEFVSRSWLAFFAVASLFLQAAIALSAAGLESRQAVTGTATDLVPLLGAAAGGLASIGLALRGALLLRVRALRLRAFTVFRLAVLANVLVTDVFYFDLVQFSAVFALGYDLLLLGAVSAEAQRLRRAQAPTGPRAAVGSNAG